jgi:hypothetical protein
MFVNNAEMELPLKEVAPISQNIKSFQRISIRFVVPFFLLVKIYINSEYGIDQLGLCQFSLTHQAFFFL